MFASKLLVLSENILERDKHSSLLTHWKFTKKKVVVDMDFPGTGAALEF
jgi:hypothetical protein